MIILAADDEAPALRALKKEITVALPESEMHGFTKISELLNFAGKVSCDVAFLDIEMREMNGLMLAKRLKDIYPKTNIIFVTGYSEYALDAFSVNASGYLLKPVDAADIQSAMENLRHPPTIPNKHRIQVQCFGNFEVFSDGTPLPFTLQKEKELFAYLISRRGAWCSVREIAAVLWEDKPDSDTLQGHLRILVANLSQALTAMKAEDILLKKRGMLAVNPETFDCDLYSFFKGDGAAVNCYAGEFMAQYSWAEFMNTYFENMK